MYASLLLLRSLLPASVFLVCGAWADGWDFSVFQLVQGGTAEFSWRSVVAILCYAAAATCVGFSLGVFRRAALEARSLDPEADDSMPLLDSENYGLTLALSYLLGFLSLPAGLALILWQYFAH